MRHGPDHSFDTSCAGAGAVPCISSPSPSGYCTHSTLVQSTPTCNWHILDFGRFQHASYNKVSHRIASHRSPTVCGSDCGSFKFFAPTQSALLINYLTQNTRQRLSVFICRNHPHQLTGLVVTLAHRETNQIKDTVFQHCYSHPLP